MATSKALQQANIIEMVGSTIRIAHPSIKNNIRTALSASINAAGTAMSVTDNNALVNADEILVGEVGDNDTEEVAINGAVTRGQSVTVANTMAFSHDFHAPVTKLIERKIKIYTATTAGGAGTLLPSLVAGAGFTIQWNRKYSEYTLIAGTDALANFYYATFFDGVTESTTPPAASFYVAAPTQTSPPGGVSSSMTQAFIEDAAALTDTSFDNQRITRELAVRWANDAQNSITQFTYQNPITGQWTKKDWSFEIIEDKSSLTITTNENQYNLSGLTVASKYPNSDRSIIDIRIGPFKPLQKITIDDLDVLLSGTTKTYTTVQAAVADTTLTVTSTAEFTASGALYVGAIQITYTAKTATTFTGIPAAGTGSITAIQVVNSAVWQNMAPSLPTKYCIFNGTIFFDFPPQSTISGYPIKLRYLSALNALTKTMDITQVTFTTPFKYYIGAQMELRKDNIDMYNTMMKQFNDTVLANAMSDRVQSFDVQPYYAYDPTL